MGGVGWMAWRVEKHDMMAGQAHGRDLQQSLGLGSGVWMGGKGGRGGMQGENFLWREREVQWSVSLK